MNNTKLKKSSAQESTAGPDLSPEGKKDRVIALLRRDGGATLTEITDETRWLPHSARAVLTGLRKKGYKIEKARADGVTRWSIVAVSA
jgi:hypothetical protein